MDEEKLPPPVLVHDTVPVGDIPVTETVQVEGVNAGTVVHVTKLSKMAGEKLSATSAHPKL